MDSAIETLSTTSDHSVASSVESTAALRISKRRSSHSPSNYSSNHTGGNGNRPSSRIDMQQQNHHLINNNGGGSGNSQQTSNGASNGLHHRRSLSPGSSPPPPPPQPSALHLATHRGGGNSGGHPASPPSSAAALSHQQIMQQMHHHQLSPPHVSTPNSLGAQMGPRGIPHLPPHSLGLLNSLQMMHHPTPLELMAAAHHHVPPRSYNSPPPISTSDPSANECKLVEYRGQKVAAFIISCDTMLCLPQAFELFLKHLVGGLHTVYTKLKRLDIVPLVCNVEQVRILRGLGAIQPGVNRCKLLSCKDFDILYRDCTTARCLSIKPPESSRPGRPPKRGPVGLSLSSSSSAAHLSAAVAAAGHPQLKKHRLDNGSDYGYENGHITDISRLDKSPLLANGYNPPPINHMAFMQMNHHHPGSAIMNPSGLPAHGMHRPNDSASMLKAAQAAAAAGSMSTAAGMDAIARSGIWENCRAAYEDIVKHLERNYRLREERTDDGRSSSDQKPRDLSSRNGSPGQQSPVLNLSKSGYGPDDNVSHLGDGSDRSDIGAPSPAPNSSLSVRDDNEILSDDNMSDDEAPHDKDEDLSDDNEVDRELSQPVAPLASSTIPSTTAVQSAGDATAAVAAAAAAAAAAHQRALNYSTLAAAANSGVSLSTPPNDPEHTDQQSANGGGGAAGGSGSSTETLLRNIQSLLKVAADNARQQERQITYEKAELKMDVLREREVKDSLERQLVEERKLRVLYQKRYRRERKIRIRLQQQFEGKMKSSSSSSSAIASSSSVAAAAAATAATTSAANSSPSVSTDEHYKSELVKCVQDGDNKISLKSEKFLLNEKINNRRSSESPTPPPPPPPLPPTASSTYNLRGNSSGSETNERESSTRIGSSDRNDRIGSGGGNSSERNSERSDHPTTSGTPSTMPTVPVTVDGTNGSSGSNGKVWNYPAIDLMATGAFWQNYSESLAQEIEMERKVRQQQQQQQQNSDRDRDAKSPQQQQQQQQSYYKNSVLFGSAT